MKNTILIIATFITFQLFAQNNNPYIIGKDIINTTKNNPIDTIIQSCISEINQDSIKFTMRHLQNFGTRFSLAPNRKDIATWIQDKFISMGYNTILDSFELSSHFTPDFYPDTNTIITMQYNVVATITGSANPYSEYLIGSHYDSYSTNEPMLFAPGADDNASGIASMIEIARVIKKNNFIPESTIKFIAFAAEEIRSYSNIFGGSQHYISDTTNKIENIGFFITNDMISNNTDNTNRNFIINHHTTSGFAVQLANEICNNYTNLTPVNNLQPMMYGSDNIPFACEGIPALYITEDELPLNYHSDGDTVGNCNMAYCAEITKVSAGMLIKASLMPANINKLFIVNPGDGHTLIPTWESNRGTNFAGYKVHIGRASNNYDSVINTTDTFYVFNNLSNDTMYYIGISAINTNGIESYNIIEKSDAPAITTFDQGILIIKDSKLGIQISSEQQLDDFYNEICEGFDHEQYDASTTNKLSLNIIGKYSSILWYVNKKGWTTSVLPRYQDLLINYLNLGGHILFTLYQPSRIIEDNTLNHAVYRKGSFIYDYANISMTVDTTTTRFCGTIPVENDMDSLLIDSLKMPTAPYYQYQLPSIEAIYPSSNGNAIFLFNSWFDSTTVQGSYFKKPVGIENKGSDINVITISFPLYYIKTDQAKDFIYHVMNDKFHENYLGIKEGSELNNSDIFIYPNPSTNQITINFKDFKTDELILYNMCGTIVYKKSDISNDSSTIDLSKFSKGIYILKVINGHNVYFRKIIKS